MEIDVRIRVGVPDEVADALKINEDSILESYYEDGYICIRKVPEDEIEELSHEYEECSNCENCAMFCAHCQHCILDEQEE